MTSDEGFLQAILAAPDDDMVRLVYADWLEEHGDPARAEFIRVQIELARIEEDDPRRPYLHYRERSLERDYHAQWRAQADCPEAGVVRFVRGFVEEITLPAASFLNHAESMFARIPLRGVRLLFCPPFIDFVAVLPALRLIQALDLSFSGLSPPQFLTLLQSPHVRSLKHLSVAGNRLPPHTIDALAASRSLENLTSLDLGGNDIGDDGAASLSAFPALHGLESLNLWNASGYYSLAMHARGAMALAQSGLLGLLRRLNLNDHQIGDAGLRELASSGELTELTHLELQRNSIGSIGDAGIEALALSTSLTRLRYLDLSGNEIGIGGGRALAIWRGLEQVRFLGLEGCAIGDAGIRALARSVHVGGLRELKLDRNRIGDRGAETLLESPYLTPSLRIDLTGNLISPELREALADRYRIDFD
jgi:uncharacterized protein (TIGR02996 family)